MTKPMQLAKAVPTTDGNDGLYALPDGRRIHHVNAYETDFLVKEIFEQQCYSRHGVCLDDCRTVFDVGANIGLFTLFVSRCAPEAEIFAFEPSPAVLEMLRMNAEQHARHARVFECGLSDVDGSAEFTYYPGYSIMSGFLPDRDADRNILREGIAGQLRQAAGNAPQVSGRWVDALVDQKLSSPETSSCETRRLSSIIREFNIERIDLLKIDAEKCERQILAGIGESDWPKIRQLVIELHDFSPADCDEVTALLNGHGFELTIEQEAHFSESRVFNVYAVRRS